MKFVATYTTCAQVGENSWQDYKMSKVFDYTQPLSEVMTWLESLGVKEPNLSCVVLSDLVDYTDVIRYQLQRGEENSGL